MGHGPETGERCRFASRSLLCFELREEECGRGIGVALKFAEVRPERVVVAEQFVELSATEVELRSITLGEGSSID